MNRRDNPPPRPPAPKLSLGKLSGRQHSTGSIAIHFNASSLVESDDYDLDDDLTIGGKTSNVVQFEMGRKPEDNCDEPQSKSAPVSEVTTPISSPQQTHHKLPSRHSPASEKGFIKIDKNDVTEYKEAPAKEKEKSFISGIREKLSDKIPDNLNAIIGKIEDQLSGEASPEDGKEKKLKKSESLDSGKNIRSGGNASEKMESFLSGHKSHSRHSSMDSNHSTGVNEGTSDTVFLSGEQKVRSHSNSFEMVDDFFGEEPFEDFAGAYGGPSNMSRSSSKNSIGKSPSYEHLQSSLGTSPQKSKLGFQKFLKNKGGSNAPGRPVSMTLSGLYRSNKGSEQEEEELVEAMEAEEFFDPPDAASQEDAGQSSQKALLDNFHKKSSSGAVPAQKIIATIVCIFAYLIVPLPTYMSGMVVGAALAAVGILVYQWFSAPPKPKPVFSLPDLKILPPLLVPEMKQSRNEDGKFKGWMNELNQYNPDDYHINQTASVYVQLEGTALRLQRPKHNIPKRAMWDEQVSSATFIHQRHIDLLGSKVYLLPHGLVKKRIWSKKYPVAIALSKSGTKWEKTLQVQNSTESDSQQMASPGKENRSFESVAKESCSDTLLYLFGRTGREKEEWYRRLKSASEGLPLPTKSSDLVPMPESSLQKRASISSTEPAPRHKRQGSTDSVSSTISDKDLNEAVRPEQTLAEYLKYMSRIMPANRPCRSRVTSPSGTRKESPKMGLHPQPLLCEPHLLWANAVVGRLFWDFLREPYWAEKMKDKIQRKLSKIHVPFFIDELLVTGIELGNQVPILRRSSRPYLDDRGLWVDVDVAYNGGFHMSLETKVNLMKLKKKDRHHKESGHSSSDKRSPVTDSDEEDSAESSTDEEGGEENVVEAPDAPPDAAGSHSTSTGKKLLRLVDKITASRYFQQATEYKYIKQAMEQVSNTPLQLSVELQCLTGTLAVNIPPPPSDRIWYGFRTNPRLWLSARPKVGERQVTVTHVTEWIEKKLSTEFQRVFVMPNMDDIPIPLMCDHLEPSPLEPSNSVVS